MRFHLHFNQEKQADDRRQEAGERQEERDRERDERERRAEGEKTEHAGLRNAVDTYICRNTNRKHLLFKRSDKTNRAHLLFKRSDKTNRGHFHSK